MTNVYLDHNATTALKPQVLEAMMPWLVAQSGNPTSRHVFGRAARDAIEYARTQVAEACGAYSNQVLFTASGTEANNFAIKGMANHLPNAQILTSAIEHPCVTKPAAFMQQFGFSHQVIPVTRHGIIDLAQLEAQLKTPTSVVSVMLANNETGVQQDILAIAKLVRAHGALMHTDAVQGVCKIPLSFADLYVNAMTVSSHKIGGPQGAAALVIDKRVDITPLMHGGGQERGLRSGTENLAAIVGFGAACALAHEQVTMNSVHTKVLRNAFEIGLKSLAQSLKITTFGSDVTRLPNTSFFAIDGIEGETLVVALDRKGYAVASGSACSSDSTEPSHVLLAMGVNPDTARGAVRVSFGEHNTMHEVTGLLSTLSHEIQRLQHMTAIAA